MGISSSIALVGGRRQSAAQTWKGREKAATRVDGQLERLQDYLDKDGTFEGKLEKSTFKDIMVAQAVLVDKLLLLDGQPTQIIGTAERSKLDELLPALHKEIQRRGLSATLTERTRTAELTLPPESGVTPPSTSPDVSGYPRGTTDKPGTP